MDEGTAEQENKSPIPEAKKILRTNNDSLVYSWFFMGSIALVLGVLIMFVTVTTPPKTFPVPSTITYEKDEYVSTLIQELKQKGYIHSETLFKIFLKLSGREGSVQAGSYYFDTPLTVSELAHRFAVGDINQKQIRITIPEGSNNTEITKILSQKYPDLNTKDFLKKIQDSEGKLFPETYFFESNTTPDEIIERMKREFNEVVEPLFTTNNITEEKQKQKIIILASLLEEEGKSFSDKQKIAGILIKRLSIGMPLQVDATINYIKGENSKVYFSELEIESPYNTYKNKGLPPTPITNPGLDSFKAALSPVETDYLYYLTGADGNFYYAKTFEEHVKNKAKYLR